MREIVALSSAPAEVKTLLSFRPKFNHTMHTNSGFLLLAFNAAYSLGVKSTKRHNPNMEGLK